MMEYRFSFIMQKIIYKDILVRLYGSCVVFFFYESICSSDCFYRFIFSLAKNKRFHFLHIWPAFHHGEFKNFSQFDESIYHHRYDCPEFVS